MEVTARILEKYGIEEMEKKSAERRVNLALPRTTITVCCFICLFVNFTSALN